MTQTKISKAYQVAISAEAIRVLGLRPGMRVRQIIDGRRLILEPVEEVDALAGSLSAGKCSRSVEELKATARAGIVAAGMAGTEDED